MSGLTPTQSARSRCQLVYSITSSARASSTIGTPMPSALAVCDQVGFGGLLDRQVGRFLAFEIPAGIDTDQMVLVGIGGSIAHQAAGHREAAKLGDRGHCVACREGGEVSAPAIEECIGADHESASSLLDQGCEWRFELALAARPQHMDLQPEGAGRRLQVSSIRLGENGDWSG